MTDLHHLRQLFTHRDTLAAQLAEQDAAIAVAIREIARAQGVSFLRVEAARRLAFDAQEAA